MSIQIITVAASASQMEALLKPVFFLCPPDSLPSSDHSDTPA